MASGHDDPATLWRVTCHVTCNTATPSSITSRPVSRNPRLWGVDVLRPVARPANIVILITYTFTSIGPLQWYSALFYTLLHPLLIKYSFLYRNILSSHLRVLWTTSAALSLLSRFRLLSLAHSRVMDRPAGAGWSEVRGHDHEDHCVCTNCVPDMSSSTVTTPTTEVNIMEEKQ